MARIFSLGAMALIVTLLTYGAWLLLSGSRAMGTLQEAPVGAAGRAAEEGRRQAQPGEGRRPARPGAPAVQEPSFQELKSRAEQLSEAELAAELGQLDARIEQEDWINRANADDLSPAERQDFALLLRQKNALAVVRALRQVAAIELVDES